MYMYIYASVQATTHTYGRRQKFVHVSISVYVQVISLSHIVSCQEKSLNIPSRVIRCSLNVHKNCFPWILAVYIRFEKCIALGVNVAIGKHNRHKGSSVMKALVYIYNGQDTHRLCLVCWHPHGLLSAAVLPLIHCGVGLLGLRG